MMDFYKQNKKKLDEIFENTQKNNKLAVMKSVNEYFQQISLNVSIAINPVTEATLPFVIYVLEHYARELKRGKEKEIEAVLKSIENLASAVNIKIPGGFGGVRNEDI